MPFGATALLSLIAGAALGLILARRILPERVRSELPALTRAQPWLGRWQRIIEGILMIQGAWALFSARPLVQALVGDLRDAGFVRTSQVAPDALTRLLIIGGMIVAVALAYRVGYDAATFLIPPNSREVDLFGVRWSWDPAISELARGPYCPDRGHAAPLVRASTNEPPDEDDVIGAADDPLVCNVAGTHAITFTDSPAPLRIVRRQATALMQSRRI